jgi:hypothetical protein
VRPYCAILQRVFKFLTVTRQLSFLPNRHGGDTQFGRNEQTEQKTPRLQTNHNFNVRTIGFHMGNQQFLDGNAHRAMGQCGEYVSRDKKIFNHRLWGKQNRRLLEQDSLLRKVWKLADMLFEQSNILCIFGRHYKLNFENPQIRIRSTFMTLLINDNLIVQKKAEFQSLLQSTPISEVMYRLKSQ